MRSLVLLSAVVLVCRGSAPSSSPLLTWGELDIWWKEAVDEMPTCAINATSADDCYPQADFSAGRCAKRRCCWNLDNLQHGRPPCYFPKHYHYKSHIRSKVYSLASFLLGVIVFAFAYQCRDELKKAFPVQIVHEDDEEELTVRTRDDLDQDSEKTPLAAKIESNTEPEGPPLESNPAL